LLLRCFGFEYCPSFTFFVLLHPHSSFIFSILSRWKTKEQREQEEEQDGEPSGIAEHGCHD
jgi:hypothetical protein